MNTRNSPSFRLGTFSGPDSQRWPGLVLDDERVIRIDHLQPFLQRLGLRLERADSVLGLLDAWPANFGALRRVVLAIGSAQVDPTRDLGIARIDSLQIHAPIDLPRQIFCTIANYRGHIIDSVRDPEAPCALGSPETPECLARAQEVIEQRLRGKPYVCVKPISTVIGPFDALEIPRHARKMDWELELGVVMGARCRRATRDNALSFVAGYTLVNDITLRELVVRPDWPKLSSDWLQSKSGPGFLPTGPFLVPAEFVPSVSTVRLQLSLNGERMQDELAADMLFDIAAQIEYISQHTLLLPGDIICTGTPAGCGTRYQRFLKPGDVMECTAEGFGTQRTTCVAEAS